MELSDISQKELPHSVEAEQTVLGALLADPELITTALERLKPESFYVESHAKLFSIMMKNFTMGERYDIITLLDEAVGSGIFESSAAGKNYLAKIMEGVPSLGNIDSYCKIIEEKYYLRALIGAGKEIIRSCTESPDSAEILIDSAEQMIYDIRQGKDVTGLTRVDEVLVEVYDHLGKLSGEDRDKYLGERSGYGALDKVITGLNKSDLLILAARPGMGKTSFALNIAANVCRVNHDKKVVVFSLEMSKEQLVTRLLSSESLVDSDHLMKGNVENDWDKLADGANRISAMNMYIDDTAGITVMQMKAKLRRISDLGLVIIDYLQLMNSGRKIDNRVNEISEITRQLKLMAKELNVPVMTLSQLSRSVESRTDKRPILSDLRESGSIEQDADIVMFLYREGYYEREKCKDINLSECIVAKNRHGETGTVNLRWNGKYTRFISEERRNTI